MVDLPKPGWIAGLIATAWIPVARGIPTVGDSVRALNNVDSDFEMGTSERTAAFGRRTFEVFQDWDADSGNSLALAFSLGHLEEGGIVEVVKWVPC